MDFNKTKKIPGRFLMLAFILPFLGMCTVMAIRGFIPFGETSMLYSDMYHQYYPFFVSFREALLSGDSLLYTWSTGMGQDFMGMIAYYLASPLNLLSVLIPEDLLLGYFSMLTPIKLGLAGLFFSIMLKKLFEKDDLSISVFGCLYALCAWALGYQWNIMWMDTFALLPLVALGTVSLLKNRKFALYTISLFFSLLCNYYIGLFTCIFVALTFLCYQICRWGGLKKFFFDLGRIALFSFLAIGMTAFLTLPAYAALQTTQSSINTFPTGFRLNIADEHTWQGLLGAMKQVAGNMNGAIPPSFKEGLPNLYCGILTNILAFLFLTCKQVKLRDKICTVCLLLFFNVSFIIRQLDYIWHGFHFTNMIPYRFSFLYSFVMLYMAYRAWLLRNRFKLWQIIFALILSVAIMLCYQERDAAYWAYNGIFLLLYGAAMIYPHLYIMPQKSDGREKFKTVNAARKRRRITSSYMLLGIAVAELALSLANYGFNFTGTVVTDYPRGTQHTASMIRYMKQRERQNLFYRAETTHSQTLNDGALNSYNGISTFTSSANVNVTKFMAALGYGAKDTYNRYCFEESSPVANLFLNLKYMLERQDRVEENRYFTDLHTYGKVHLLENNAYLPLAFLSDAQLINVDFSAASANSFYFQNELLRAASGVQEDVWSLLTGNQLSISATDVTLGTQTQTGYCSYSSSKDGGSIVYRYMVEEEGFVCIDLDLSQKNNFSVWKNGAQLYSESYSVPQSLSVADTLPGDIIEIHLTCKRNEKGSITIHTAILNDEVFQKAYKHLSNSVLELTAFQNTRIEGSIQCNRDGVLYTSIPQNGNWAAMVDGKPAETILIGGAMVGLLLTEGYHDISFVYRNPSFSLGLIISLGCIAIFVSLYLWIHQPRRKAGKYERRGMNNEKNRRRIS